MSRPSIEDRVATLRGNGIPRSHESERYILTQNGYDDDDIRAFYESRRWGRERVGGGLPQLHRAAEQRLAEIRGLR